MARRLTEQHRLQLPGSACLPPTEVASEGENQRDRPVTRRMYSSPMRTAMRIFAVAVAAAAVAAVSPRLSAQQIPLTDKITRLDGTWGRVPEKGRGGICGVPASNGMRLSVSAEEIWIHGDTFSQGVSSKALMPIGEVKIDGMQIMVFIGRTVTA